MTHITYTPYTPTAEDRENDRREEAWKAGQRAKDLRILQERIARERREKLLAGVNAYAERIGGAK